VRDDPPNLAEVQIRSEIEAEVRDELAQEQLTLALSSRDRRFLALAISLVVVSAVLLPIVAAIVGVSIRVFRYVAGF